MNRTRTTLLKGALLIAALIGSASQIPTNNIAEISQINFTERIAIGEIAAAKSIILVEKGAIAPNKIEINESIARSIIG